MFMKFLRNKIYKQLLFEFNFFDDPTLFVNQDTFKNNRKKIVFKVSNNFVELLWKNKSIGSFLFKNIENDNDKPKVYYISNLSITSIHRKQGLAAIMLQKFIEVCKSKNVVALELDVETHNAAAIGLYNKIGFKEIKQNDNAIRMRYILQ